MIETIKHMAKLAAQAVQANAENMTGTELNAEDKYIPEFKAAVAKKNMLERKAGDKDGFVCISSAGRVVRLLQNYDSSIYMQEPEELPAQFGFVWSKDPAKALPFISMATSPYNTGDCCTETGIVYRSTMDSNVHAPSAYPQGWEKVTE